MKTNILILNLSLSLHYTMIIILYNIDAAINLLKITFGFSSKFSEILLCKNLYYMQQDLI